MARQTVTVTRTTTRTKTRVSSSPKSSSGGSTKQPGSNSHPRCPSCGRYMNKP